MDTIQIESMLMRTWPSLEETTYDGWILRYSNGYTKRSNCINPIYESYFDIKEKFTFCEKTYEIKKLPVIYKIIDFKVGLEIDNLLEDRGFEKFDETAVYEVEIENLDFDLDDLNVTWEFNEKWFEFYSSENSLDKIEKSVLKSILLKNEKNEFYIYKQIEDEIVAGVLGVIEDDNLSIFNVYVKEKYRQKGYGKEVVEGALIEGRKRNVKRAYLQVKMDNDKAIKLYKKMGFVEKYRAWYRVQKT